MDEKQAQSTDEAVSGGFSGRYFADGEEFADLPETWRQYLRDAEDSMVQRPRASTPLRLMADLIRKVESRFRQLDAAAAETIAVMDRLMAEVERCRREHAPKGFRPPGKGRK